MNPTTVERRTDENGSRTLEKTRVRELTPPVDVYENQNELVIVADLPGVTRERLEIKIDLPELRIEARHGADEGAVWRRAFTIDERIDTEKVSAELKNGLLTVHLPKSEAVRPRKIEIRAS